ncbi:SixA phosphatase family protein [Collimonas silvisoli]|uniref:SixA phosphatase family protein n=1 Tax=Collimonas silvisoli TaxID=2825884 RepID=UPI001B8C4492|nr:histidine phosphatase family protein [Collimonas silvisoli]
MELILWRHAEAEIGEPDQGRALTGKGHKQAWKMADWLDHNLPHGCKIISSPATRTVQTAEALGRKFKTHPELAPDCSAEQLLAVANWPNNREPVLIIGHQPTLGQAAALLIAGQKLDWSIKKGNVWWIAQRERGDITTNYLKAIMSPDLIAK